MKWVTRERPKTDRIACPWLIRKFIDPDAEFLYVPAGNVLPVAQREGALSYDAPGARYTHRDGLCSFEVLVDEYAIDDPAPGCWRGSSTAPTSPTTATPRRSPAACWRLPRASTCSSSATIDSWSSQLARLRRPVRLVQDGGVGAEDAG